MADFLLELLSEEIPARMQDKARADLARLFAEEIAKAGLAASAVETFATPRRLALIAHDLPLATQAVSEEIKGPRTSAPAQALDGFLRKTGLSRDRLVERDGVWFALIDKPGRATAEVVAEAVPALIRAFPWPKSMRWGAASAESTSLRWVRPLQGIVALLGEDVVPLEVAGIRAGAATVGHRFHHPGAITIGSAADYAAKLRACHVIVDAEERKAFIRTRAAALGEAAGLSVVPDEGLVAENAGLTEWPVPILGSFDPAFLAVPPEVIQLTMRTNQKYFALNDAGGKLAPAFICTANIEAADGGAAIAAGNARVLAARLSDAKFFWEQDLKVPLEEQAQKLSQIVFHEKLGTVADKVERVAKLARWLVEEGIVTASPSPLGGEGRGEGEQAQRASALSMAHPPLTQPSPPRGEGYDRAALADMAEQAARFCKADLVTGMVGEFPELQGVMGGYYARAQGLPPQVADAIRDHYKPVGQGDDVPTAPVTVAVSLADKLDTICGFFLFGEKPTGSKDPFALRRAAIGIIELALANSLPLETMHLFARSTGFYHRQLEKRPEYQTEEWRDGLGKLITAEFYGAVTEFLIDRLKVQQRSVGTRHDLIDAVFATGDDQPVRLLARVKALQAFVGTGEGADLLAGYRRAANILKKEGWDSPSPRGGEGHEKQLSYTPEKEEAALIAALDVAEPAARAAVAAEDFEGAMAALAALRGPIDAFFDKVTVNDSDPARRAARLALLARVRDAVHAVADFSRIEG
ncbi:MAG: glycine--tRNA ligase subunit beta [Sphingomonadaceae bacterium]|nr:glycine--tRNA ligase subunit beta [Sphingomonadaceae bacterium]